MMYGGAHTTAPNRPVTTAPASLAARPDRAVLAGLAAGMPTMRAGTAKALAAWAWAAVGLTPVGWFYGFMAIGYSHLGDVTDREMMFGGVVLFAVSPTIAFILAVYAACAGHRSGKIAVVVSGLLLLALLLASAWLSGGWINVAVIAVMAVVAVPVFAWARSRIKRDSICGPRVP
jgi:hypothetical protein